VPREELDEANQNIRTVAHAFEYFQLDDKYDYENMGEMVYGALDDMTKRIAALEKVAGAARKTISRESTREALDTICDLADAVTELDALDAVGEDTGHG
jgi:hypothetical protein